MLRMVIIECKDCGRMFEYIPEQRGILPDHELANGEVCQQSGHFGKEVKMRPVKRLIRFPRLRENLIKMGL